MGKFALFDKKDLLKYLKILQNLIELMKLSEFILNKKNSDEFI